MTKYFLPIIGLALLWSVPFLGQAPAAARADDATCCGNAGCESCCNCCPHCGCKLVPICHIYCTTKKVTTFKYTCKCETICVPGVTRLCDKCGNRDGDGSGQCAGGGENGNSGSQDCCDGCCRCRIHEVKQLVKIPCDKEVPVKKCTVEWVCPNCGDHGHCTESAAPSPPAPSLPTPPHPPAPGKSAVNVPPDESVGPTIHPSTFVRSRHQSVGWRASRHPPVFCLPADNDRASVADGLRCRDHLGNRCGGRDYRVVVWATFTVWPSSVR